MYVACAERGAVLAVDDGPAEHSDSAESTESAESCESTESAESAERVLRVLRVLRLLRVLRVQRECWLQQIPPCHERTANDGFHLIRSSSAC